MDATTIIAITATVLAGLFMLLALMHEADHKINRIVHEERRVTEADIEALTIEAEQRIGRVS